MSATAGGTGAVLISFQGSEGRLPLMLGFCLFLLGGLANGQNNLIQVLALDGRNGRPMAHEQILIFIGTSDKDLKEHKKHIEVRTDSNGIAVVPLAEMPKGGSLQVWLDRRTLCHAQPNSLAYSIDEIKERGLSTPNFCGSAEIKSVANRLVLFARPATFREKMGW